MVIVERKLEAVERGKDGKIRSYKNYEKNNFYSFRNINGFDANILVDLVCSEEFKEEVKRRVNIKYCKVYTTTVAWGEAFGTLVKKKGYNEDEALIRLKEILDIMKIETIKHEQKYNDVGESWAVKVKNKINIKNPKTFPNDCKILSNLFYQKRIDTFLTEDRDIKNIIKILNLPIRVKIIGEVSNLNNFKIDEFFRRWRYTSLRKKRRRS